jgi:hypothetical protein
VTAKESRPKRFPLWWIRDVQGGQRELLRHHGVQALVWVALTLPRPGLLETTAFGILQGHLENELRVVRSHEHGKVREEDCVAPEGKHVMATKIRRQVRNRFAARGVRGTHSGPPDAMALQA